MSKLHFTCLFFKELLSQVVDLEQTPSEIRCIACFIREQSSHETYHLMTSDMRLFFFFQDGLCIFLILLQKCDSRPHLKIHFYFRANFYQVF